MLLPLSLLQYLFIYMTHSVLIKAAPNISIVMIVMQNDNLISCTLHVLLNLFFAIFLDAKPTEAQGNKS